MNEIKELQDKGLIGFDLIITSLNQRIQPLQARKHLMWAYTGVCDCTRGSEVEISDKVFMILMKSPTKECDELNRVPHGPPYSIDNPPPNTFCSWILCQPSLRTVQVLGPLTMGTSTRRVLRPETRMPPRTQSGSKDWWTRMTRSRRLSPPAPLVQKWREADGSSGSRPSQASAQWALGESAHKRSWAESAGTLP